MLSYLKARARGALWLILCALVFAGVFALYGLLWQAALYAAALCLMLLLARAAFGYPKYREKRAQLNALVRAAAVSLDRLPAPGDPVEADYQVVLRALFEDRAAQLAESSARFDGMTEYYTLWAHQIKTPISAMRLLLQEGNADTGELKDELFKIGQYVEMALCYLRLGSESTDYVLRSVDLDGVVRQALRKYAPQFIRRKIRLDYEPARREVLTDGKWLLFVIEQVLSNALKYTPAGTIAIRLEAPATLAISDTGIGIAPEDLPRVFEKGFTGLNGRLDARATGIGLYLCRRILKKLGHGISVASEVGRGTTVRLDLESKPLRVE